MSDNPFGGLFGDLFNVLGQQGPDAWYESARTLAMNVVRQGDGDPNPEPRERQRVEQFAPLVARHVAALFEVPADGSVTAVTRTELALSALDQWRPLIQPLLDRPAPEIPGLEGAGQLLGQLAEKMGPLFTGLQLGSVAGHFAERAWSRAALELPRSDARALLAVNNVRLFVEEWSLDADATTVFALAQEITAAVVLSQPGAGDALRALLIDAVTESARAQGDILQRLSQLVDPEDPAGFLNNPEALLEQVTAPDDSDATRAINAATAVLRVAIDEVALSVTAQIVGPVGQLREAYRRHRLADARGEDAAAALFGIDNHGPHLAAAEEFVGQVVEAHGLAAFTALLRADGLPRFEELSSPTDWFERVSSSPLA